MGRYRKVYVLAPARVTTGGVELAHQLVDALTSLKQDAYVVYVDRGQLAPGTEVPAMYRKYRVRVSDVVEDSQDNLLVLPEIFFDYLYQFPVIRIACWWMSVDNHYYSACLTDMLHFSRGLRAKMSLLYRYLKGEVHYRNSLSDLRGQRDRVIHLYQSAYARDHLASIGFPEAKALSDYIHPDLLVSRTVEKENMILYNPKKGVKYVDRLKKRLPEYRFVALQGMTREELNGIFDRAKLYVDFGPFPGKDRIPREAVVHGCCLITGRFGASVFFEDLPIPPQYQFNVEKSGSWKDVERMARSVLSDYEGHRKDFDLMRTRIDGERAVFEREVADLFI